MKTPSAVLLLLWAGLLLVRAEHTDLQEKSADTTSTQLSCQPDIHTVLREMSTLVAKLEVELKYTKTQMDAVEARLTERLRASENTAETLETKLRASENKAEALETRLRATENLVEQLKAENAAHAVNLSLAVNQVQELRRVREGSRVSFSAGLLGSGSGPKGPFSEETPLVYRYIFNNIGNAYNPNTGIFTAPVRGVYYFVLFVFGFAHASRDVTAILYKNGEHILNAGSQQVRGYVRATNGASLLLEVGDVVYAKLKANSWVYDSQNHHTTFTGYLLFPM